MSTATRVSLAEAESVARKLVEILGPACERIEIAGSIRRRRPDVGDIELVAVPRIHTERLADGLFDNRDVEVDELQVVVAALLADCTLASHPDDPKRGSRYSKLIHCESGLQVDLFSARAETFGLIFMIRTGPASFSQWLVTEAKARRFHVAGGQLHRGGMGCGSVPCAVVATPEESDVFNVLQIHPLSPQARG